jgi:prepilin-type N-terminal cleavage/methylation domain-containing protein
MKPTKKNKGFTLIELLVVVTIVAIFASLVFGSISGCQRNDGEPLFYNTEYENMKANKQQAEEFKRANDLRERELQLQEMQLQQNK